MTACRFLIGKDCKDGSAAPGKRLRFRRKLLERCDIRFAETWANEQYEWSTFNRIAVEANLLACEIAKMQIRKNVAGCERRLRNILQRIMHIHRNATLRLTIRPRTAGLVSTGPIVDISRRSLASFLA